LFNEKNKSPHKVIFNDFSVSGLFSKLEIKGEENCPTNTMITEVKRGEIKDVIKKSNEFFFEYEYLGTKY
jgi:hypothetical protein